MAVEKILVIEDEKGVRELYQELLGELYQVDFSVSGRDGFIQATFDEYDLIIADLHMESWNGAEAVAAIHVTNPGKKFIIVSGFLESEKYQKTLEGIPNIIAKNFQTF